MEAIRTVEQREGLVRPLAALAAEPHRHQVHEPGVHEWHETDETLIACGLPAAGERLAADDGQADCPGCLEALADERRAGNAARAWEARGAPAEWEHGRDETDRDSVGPR